MSLEQLAQSMRDAISNDTLKLTESLAGTPAFNQVLKLMALNKELNWSSIKPADIQVKSGVLTASGTGSLYGTGGPLQLNFTGEDVASRTCGITGTLDELNFSELKTSGLINTSEFNPQQLPPQNFKNLALTAKSSEQTVSISAPNVPTDFGILPLLNITLTKASFVLQRTIGSFGDLNINLTLGGVFSLDDAVELGIAITVPVMRTQSQQWTLTFSGNTGDKPVSIANLVQIAAGTNLFAMMPPGFAGIGDFCLNELSISFIPSPASVSLITLTIGTTKPKWELFSGFSIIKPRIDFTIFTPFSGPGVEVSVEGSFELAESLLLGVSMTASFQTGTWILSLTTDTANMKLGNLSGAPGGIDFGALQLPDGINTDMPIMLEEFTIVFNTRFKTFNSMTINVYSTKSWDVMGDGKLKVGEPNFEFTITDPLNQFQQRDFSLVLSGRLRVVDMLKMDFTLKHPSNEEGWIMSAATNGSVAMAPFFDKLYGSPISWPDSVKDLTLKKLSFTYYAKTSTYEFLCTIGKVWSITLGSETFSIEQVAVTYKYDGSKKPVITTSGSIEGQFNIFGLMLTAGYKFSGTSKDVYFIFNNTIEVHYKDNDILTFQLRNTTLGDMIVFMVKLVSSGNSDFSLPAPWDLLNKISLNGFMITIKLSDKTVSFEYQLPQAVDLGFIRINKLGITKTPGSKVNILLDCVFLGQKQDVGWDVLNEQPPAVPGMGDKYFELKFAAMGQRVKLADAANTDSVVQAITSMQNAFEPPKPDTNPLANTQKITFNQGSNWLIGTRFIVMSAIDVAAVFNDPELYGLSIGIAGERFQKLKGLQFEILYKKLTETIGVYEIELRLPDIMRQFEFGQVSITLPIIGISIYTNGGFKLDLGFPYNGDFSRSFTLQVFPFIGSGGFYFGYLGDAPSKRLPEKYNQNTGTFNPVIEFGLGLSVGVGKTISMGVLSAGISITVQGIVEGTMAFFNANTTQYPQLRDEMYYWLQGSVGIAGHVFGKVDFVVVKANVDLKVYALIRLTYASYQPIYIYLEAGVKVSVSITIDLWLFSVTLNFSFSATIRQSFTIPGAGGTAPWYYNTLDETRSYRSISLAGNPSGCDSSGVSWKTFDLANKHDLSIYLLPQFSAGAGEEGERSAFYIASLFLRSSALKTEPVVEEEDFDRLMRTVWIYAAAAALPISDTITNEQTVSDSAITAEQLDHLFCFITSGATEQAPLRYDQIMGMISGCFTASLQSPESTGDVEYEVALFPMIPGTTLSIQLNEDTPYEVDFSTKTLCTAAYHQTILDYFEKLVVQYENSVNGPDTRPKVYEETKLSLSTFVFQDYFLLVMRQLVQGAIDLLKNYLYDWEANSSFEGIVTQFYSGDENSFAEIAEANRDVDLLAGAQLKISGIQYPVTADNNFAAIAAVYEKDAQKQTAFLQQLAAVNLNTPQLILGEVTIDLGDGNTHITGVNETLDTLAKTTGVDAAQLVVLNKSLPLLVALSPVTIPELVYTVAGANENLGSVAQQYNSTPARVLASSKGQTGLYAENTILTLPNLGSLKVGDILTQLVKANTFQHLSGLVSKFMLGGLRVPPPPDENVESNDPQSLYNLTGQQYALPELNILTDLVKIKLKANEPLSLGEAEYLLRDKDIDFVNTLRGLNPQADVKSRKKQSFSKTEARKFNLSNKIDWQSTEPVRFVQDNSQQPYTQAALWSLSPTLQTMLQEKKETLPQVGLYIGHQSNPGLPMTSDLASIYSWATLLKVQVRQVLNSTGAPVPCVYELIGLDEGGLALVEKIITHYSDTKKSSIAQVHVLFAPAASAAQPSGLISQGIDALSTFIVQSNLSTLSHPAALTSSNLGLKDGATGNLLNTDTMTSLQLLWQCSIVKTGGYYFYYRVNASNEGLPDTSFDSSHETYLYFALSLDITDGLLPNFVNAAAIGDRINEGDLLYAASEQQLINIRGGRTPQELVNQYRTGWTRMAASLAAQPLRPAVEIQVHGAIGHIPGNNTSLSQLAKQLGHEEKEWLALNPHLSSDSAPGTPFLRPSFTFRSSTPISIAEAASQTGTSITRLLFDNRAQILFDEAADLTIDDQWLYTYATIPAGNTVFLVTRANPDQRLMKRIRNEGKMSEQQTLSLLYNLLSFHVLDKAPFSPSVPSVPIGPADNNSKSEVRERVKPLLFNSDPDWLYEQALPVYRFWTPGGAELADVPPAEKSPYLGVGSLFQVGFEWRDIFGNVPVPGTASVEDLGIRIGYYDDLLPISQWPATTASYLVTKEAEQPALSITLVFDPNKYIPRRKAGCEPDPAQDPAAFRSLAIGDGMKVMTAYYQLSCADVTASLSCNISSAVPSFDKGPLIAYLGGVYRYLKIVSAEGYSYTYFTADGVLTLEAIALKYGVSLDALKTVNPGTPDVPAANSCIVIPETALPANCQVGGNITWNNTNPYFELHTSITIKRLETLVDDQFLDVPSVYITVSDINPQSTASESSDKIKPYSDFAKAFEAAFSGTRIGVGQSGSGQAQALWVVQFNDDGYTYSIKGDQPFFYAPMPLFNQLVTGTNFTVYNYVPGVGLDKNNPLLKNYSGIDLDVWASIFLAACDQVLSSSYIVPARILDACLNTTLCAALLDAKRSIASGIITLIADVQKKSDDPACTDPYVQPTENMLKLAKDALEQQLLVQLSAAYQVNAIVQFPADVKAPATTAIAPNLFGAPQLSGTGTANDKELSLSTSRIGLANGTSYLTFLFSTKRQEEHSNYPLTLQFRPNSFEYDIHPVESLNPGYTASSWLSFVEPVQPAPIGATQVPVPLRAYPAPPSLKDQQVIQEPGTSGNVFYEQRQWQYGYAYEQVSARQDLISTNLRFNVLDSNPAKARLTTDPDLFEVLAMFNFVWTDLASDLNTRLASITPASSVEDMTGASNALKTFADFMRQAGTAWNNWLTGREKYRDPITSHENYEYMIRENLDAAPTDRYEMTVQRTGLKKDARFIQPRFEGYTAQQKGSTVDSVTFELFKTDTPTIYLTVEEAKKHTDRTVAYPGLDILNTQNAWGGVFITRNKYLFTDKDGKDDTCKPTNENFVYQTPTVRYSSILTPLLSYDKPIQLSQFSPGKKLPLLDYLNLLFTNLFDKILEGTVTSAKRSMQLSCTYYYSLTGNKDDEMMVNLPVLLVPPYEFRLPEDWSTDCDTNSFICQLNKAIWVDFMQQQQPSKVLGRFVFDISVYSSLVVSQLPVLRFSDVRLDLEDIEP